MKTITAITVSQPCVFVLAGRLVQAEEGDVLVLHESPVFGRRDIDAETARQMLVSGRAEPSGFACEAVSRDEAVETLAGSFREANAFQTASQTASQDRKASQEVPGV